MALTPYLHLMYLWNTSQRLPGFRSPLGFLLTNTSNVLEQHCRRRLSMHLDYTSHLFKQVSNLKSLSYTSPPDTVSPEMPLFCFTNDQCSSTAARRWDLLRHATLLCSKQVSLAPPGSTRKALYQSRDKQPLGVWAHRSLSTSLQHFVVADACISNKLQFISHPTGNLHQLEAIFNRSW